ncbi:hypothetical protein GGE66_002380 [Rhizobium leguminosarum]|uniref:Uncharacterized protein n=1 Tax=Rhizobium leguminosarum TaxID=384 RepID=A0A7X0DSH3_RHILE|nr:hypothetical protein [Rhizobium leguminosarum]
MPKPLVDAVWMLGSRPSMTEDGVAEEANQSTDTRE